MTKFIIKRILYGFLVMLGVITLVFFLFTILPSDPARMMMGQRSDLATEEAIRKEMGLDLPVGVQFLAYLNDLSPISWYRTNDPESFWFLDDNDYDYVSIASFATSSLVLKKPYLRRSYQTKRPVTEIIAEAFPKTLLLAVVAIFFAIIVGITIGIFCAIFKGTWFDKVALFFSVLGMSVPSFFAAILFAWVFAFLLADYTGLSMFGSLYSVDDYGMGLHIDLKNLILPAITLGIRPLALVVELTKNSVLDVLSQDYIRTARAKGLPYRTIIVKHTLKNALNPVVTAISGWLASLLAGAVFVEYIFDWKGMGVVIVDALNFYDFPVVMGSLLYVSIILVLINIINDIIYGWLDPRVKTQ
ncbi:ABC transporter permease [Bacteroidales bacterium OttesenSCG-928-B11]|nr:ABC transporter permease [Bacteroidales bacterium OttesenSCG-928-E04]MDL2308793.1 ABC transporter permease [Bacteroidales bacterium OttesenSCG-928-C03]MDL2311993.1 ABC transporter permease [Bacteroidales bacterium OttesenSCG-928-B11]